MNNVFKPPLTTEEYEAAMRRSDKIKKMLKRQGVPVYMASAAIHRNPQSVYRWLASGLTCEQYDMLYCAVNQLSLANLEKGHGG